MKTLVPGKTISINAVMGYKNDSLVRRFQHKLGLSQKEAQMLLDDVKRFLYLCATEEKRIVPPGMVDEGWHSFILFTKDYANFCQRYFGKFIHHQPWTTKSITKGQTALVAQTKTIIRRVFGKMPSKFWVFKAECSICARWS